ncbi:hypothetical protein VIBNIAM115_260003 [Vibrio nigripulchritudo AM115]|nr:hypothetical protein VIBNIAM115_260003 [Vibrio nigripulchritudo AM115]
MCKRFMDGDLLHLFNAIKPTLRSLSSSHANYIRQMNQYGAVIVTLRSDKFPFLCVYSLNFPGKLSHK